MAYFPTLGFPYFGGLSLVEDTPAATYAIPLATVTDFITDANSDALTDDTETFIGSLITANYDSLAARIQIAHDDAYPWCFDDIAGTTATPGIRRVNSISALAYHDGSAWVTIDAGSYRASTAGAWKIVYPGGFTFGREYRATLDIGYETLPGDVAEWIRDATIRAWFDSTPGKEEFGKKSVSTSQMGVTVTVAIDRESIEARRQKLIHKYSSITV